MSKLMEKMLKSGSIKEAEIMAESEFFNGEEFIPTSIPIINVAFSGKINGGIVPGTTIIAGESKSFKTLLCLFALKSYFNKYPEAIAIIYDSEFGITPKYLQSLGIDTSRVIHVPIEHVEMLKFDLTKRLKEVERGDKVFFMIDSLGMLSSKKEVDDALDEKTVADLTRAKAIRSLFRVTTSTVVKKGVPLFVVAHFYETMELYAKKIISGGQAVMLAANQAFIITKAQEKDGTDLIGWNFTINIEKSRFVREKEKLKFTVNYDKGINRWSGLIDIALESGHVIKPKMGWYQKVDMDTGEIFEKNYRLKDTNNLDFWESILKSKSFNDFVEQKYMISYNDIIQNEDDSEEVYENLETDEE